MIPPHLDREADFETAHALAEHENELDFEALLRLYYRLRPEPSEKLHRKHMAHLAGEADQARSALRRLERIRPLRRGDAVLEVGCGFGQHLAVAAERTTRLVGIDVSLPFLVLARKRVHGRGLLIAAEAERLPFRDEAFASVIAADVIEHLADAALALHEMGRVLARGAPLFLSTPNRFSLAPEPHVGLWGIGFLPRRWTNRYVRRRLAIRYDDVQPFSIFALRRALQGHFPGEARVLLPGLSARQIRLFSALKRTAALLYLIVRRIPVLRAPLYLFGPFFHVVAVKR